MHECTRMFAKAEWAKSSGGVPVWQVYNAHNLYGMSETIATAIALQQLRNKRQFILTRCALLLQLFHILLMYVVQNFANFRTPDMRLTEDDPPALRCKAAPDHGMCSGLSRAGLCN